jgi:threonyl-tRNA synthetase
MRVLLLHTNFIEYEPIKKEIAEAESCEKTLTRFEDLVVLFTAIEEGDTREVANNAIVDVHGFLETIHVNRLLIYPYAHLSNNLAKPVDALRRLTEMETYAKGLNIETYRTPFGWNKKFTISIKGHPLAEQLKIFSSKKIDGKRIEPDGDTSEALKAEDKLTSEWFIMDVTGRLTPINEFDYSKNRKLQTFSKYEIAKVRAVAQVPPHVTLMKRLEFVDYEPGSDSGNLRYYPKGRLIKSLLEQYVTQKIIEYGGMEVETPIMYDFEHPSLASYLNRFPARQYVVHSDGKDYFLRFSACFGQFLMSHDAQFSYRHLPFRIYELTKYSFRREKSGELTGLRRLRAFTMPDVHAMCGDLTQALEEAVLRFKLAMSVLEEGLELSLDDYELAIRFTRQFYENNKEFIVTLLRHFNKPALIEIWPEKFFYFTLKWEFNFIDNLDKASALSTDQIDVENAERYGITYTNEEGKEQHPIILHCSPSGAIERCMYTLLEKAYSDQQQHQVPQLPLWLSPTQVRFIPISDDFVKNCKEISTKLCDERIRTDIDDRKLTVQKRIRDAEREWIPYIICLGKKEVTSRSLAVRKRRSGVIEEMTTESLIEEITNKIKNKPFKQLSLPQQLSKRPTFT